MSHAYTFGIEEEFFVVDGVTRDARRAVPPVFLQAARAELPGRVAAEMLQSQIELSTQPCRDMIEAEERVTEQRSALAAIAAEHRLGLVAAGTHPMAAWTRQRSTDAPRYDRVMRDLQMLGHRNMLCGLHVHVELADPSRRIDVMTRSIPFLPLLLALSTSSPFWRSRRTGLMAYRLSAYQELPRTGLPDLFQTEAEFDAYVSALVQAGAIRDSSYLWWAIRPSLKHPTLELRVADSCTRVEDALAIAALYRALVRRLERDPQLNAGMNAVDRAVAQENLWRAQRYGIHGSLIDAKRGALTVPEALEALIELVGEDAQALNCEAEVEDCRGILSDGTSADVQIAVYTEALGRGLGRDEALSSVVDWLMRATLGEVASEPTGPLSEPEDVQDVERAN